MGEAALHRLRSGPGTLALIALGLGAWLVLDSSLLPRTIATLLVLLPLATIRAEEGRQLLRQSLLWTSAALLLWLCLSLAWSPHVRAATALPRLEHGLSTLGLVAVLGLLGLRLRAGAGALFLWLALAAGAVALASIVLWPGGRLFYLGGGTSPSVGGAVQGAVLAGSLALARPRGPLRPLLWASMAAIAAGLVLTQGRGPVLAVVAALLVTLAAEGRHRLALGVLGLALAASVSLAVLAPEIVFRVSADIRLGIWQAYAAHIAERPWFGHGVGDLTRVVVPAAFGGLGAYGPHSLFVGVAFHGGLVGLALFLAVLASAIWTAWRTQRSALALVVFVAINGAVDFGRMVEPLGPTWFVLWLPLGAVLAASLDREGLSASGASGGRDGTAGVPGRPPPGRAYPPR